MFYFILLFNINLLFAYQSALTSDGFQLKWVNNQIPMVLINQSEDLGGQIQNKIIFESMQEWNTHSSLKIIPVSFSINEIRFEKNWNYGTAVVAMTELSFGKDGHIQQGNILINDHFKFKETAGRHSQQEVFLGDVITHELGHLIGLSHSEVLDSSMFYSSFPGQNSLSQDDISAIKSKYKSSSGSISGVIKGGHFVGVMGAHVQAISRNTGKATGTFSQKDGSFSIQGLDIDDTYYLYSSPIKMNSSLPDYFSATQSDFCPGQYVGSFYSACGKENQGKPQGINLNSFNLNADVGIVTINCSLKTSLEYNQYKLSQNGEALKIYDYAETKLFQQAHVGWFRKMYDSAWSAEDSYKLDVSGFSAISGKPTYLKISLNSYPLGTPLEFDLRVIQNEKIIAHESIKTTPQGTLFNDLEVFIPLSNDFNDNIFNLMVKAKSLAYQAHLTFPDATSFTNEKHMPFLIITSLYEKRGNDFYALLDTESSLSDNYSCLDGPYTHGPSDTTGMNALGQKNDDFLSASACGALDSDHKESGPFMMSLCLGIFFSALTFSALLKSKKFLS